MLIAHHEQIYICYTAVTIILEYRYALYQGFLLDLYYNRVVMVDPLFYAHPEKIVILATWYISHTVGL